MGIVKIPPWLVSVKEEEKDSIEKITKFVFNIFENTFNQSLDLTERIIITNERTENSPIFCNRENPLRIDLIIENHLCWSNIIYQLSHELMHYVFWMKIRKIEILSWFEETVCEAVALYVLKVSADNWDKCELSCVNKGYFEAINSYLTETYNDISPKSILEDCHSIEQINENYPNNRRERGNERNCIYRLMIANKEVFSEVIKYTYYIEDNVLINFRKWELESDKKDIVREISKISPVIKGHHHLIFLDVDKWNN